MKERIKSLILFVLVANSLLLTWFLIFYSPNNNSVSLSEYLPRQKFGQDLNIDQIINPKQIVFHFGDNSHTLIRPTMRAYKNIENEMRFWSFFEISPVYQKLDWQEMIEGKAGIEIILPASLSYPLLSAKYKMPALNIDMQEINRLWITIDADEKVKAYFISDERDQVYVSQTTLTKEKLDEYINSVFYLPKYSYHWSYEKNASQFVKNAYYLPVEGLDLKTYRKTLTLIPEGDFIQLLFIDPILVRKVYEKNNKENVIYTDGTRSMQFFPNEKFLLYFQPVSGNGKEFEPKKDINTAIRFINQHGGWDEDYYLDRINRLEGFNQTVFKFRKYIDGYPLIENGDKFGLINMQLTDGIVSSFQRSMILIDKNFEIKMTKTTNDVQIINMLEKQQISNMEVSSVELIYNVKRTKETIDLYPYWLITIKGQDLIELPAYESVVRRFGLE